MLLPKPDDANPQIPLQGDAIALKNKLSRHISGGDTNNYLEIQAGVKRWEPTEKEVADLVLPLVTQYFPGGIPSLVLQVAEPSKRAMPYSVEHRAYSIKLDEKEQKMCCHRETVELSPGYWLVMFEAKARSTGS